GIDWEASVGKPGCRGVYLLGRRCGNVGWQSGEAVPDLVSLGDLQLLGNRQGLPPGCSRLQVAPNRTHGIAKIAERHYLALAVAQLLADGEAVLLAGDCFRILALVMVDDPEAVEAVGLGRAVAQLPVEGEAVLLAGDCFRVPPQPLVDDPEVAQAVGLTTAVAQLAVEGEAVLLGSGRLRVPPQPFVEQAEAVVGLRLGGQ